MAEYQGEIYVTQVIIHGLGGCGRNIQTFCIDPNILTRAAVHTKFYKQTKENQIKYDLLYFNPSKYSTSLRALICIIICTMLYWTCLFELVCWELFIGSCLLGVVYWELFIGSCLLGVVYWELFIVYSLFFIFSSIQKAIKKMQERDVIYQVSSST